MPRVHSTRSDLANIHPVHILESTFIDSISYLNYDDSGFAMNKNDVLCAMALVEKDTRTRIGPGGDSIIITYRLGYHSDKSV